MFEKKKKKQLGSCVYGDGCSFNLDWAALLFIHITQSHR